MTMTTDSNATKSAPTRRGRPYCGQREAFTIRIPTKDAAALRRDAEERGITLNQLASEKLRAGLAR